ncbi:unnamed protein product [Psylliodes chrysocephalus]|uniref:Carboxylic ester hydrolase n=1 Tax=Psylliodes chrysocephalus TaxID=3402493 RepID=A0A9P0D473_9CUCU|nr:unnamed protein product [Psylliodes chrysocephala]
MIYLKTFIWLILFRVISINGQQVTTLNGVIQGRIEYSRRGISFNAFLQIPYGKAGRFESPQPADPWEGVLNATSNNLVCISQVPAQAPFIESEQCLVLNVYTPKLPSEKNVSLPVLYFMHGGGFILGTGAFDFLGPHYFMEYEVIMVTINYRLGLFGFLSTEDKIISGNFGFKDQQLGLKWVQDNIKYFGGDPTKVTIFGESAGAASVSYQYLNKNSEGLFRAGIALSGSALSPWGYQRNARKYAYQMASYLNSSFNENSTTTQIRELFLSVTPQKLRDASWRIPTPVDQLMEGFLFSAVIEMDHDEAFLSKSMYHAIEQGHALRYPLMIGIASEEYILNVYDLDIFKKQLAGYDDNVTMFVNDNMHLTDQATREAAGNAIRAVYTDGLLQDNLGRGVKYFSDNSFGRGILQHAKLQSNYSDVYFYQFSYYGTKPGVRPDIPGADRVGHVDDAAYMWVTKNDSNLNDFPESDIVTSERFLTLIVNFATSLNPTSCNTELLGIKKWPTVKPDNFLYLNINDTLEVLKDLKKDIHPELVAIYEKYAIKPYETF